MKTSRNHVYALEKDSLFDLTTPDAMKKMTICIGYLCIYLPWFILLEKYVTNFHLIHCALDDKIPFCEYFVVPYLIWFPFVGMAFLWMIKRERTELFLKFCGMMFGGMTLALVIYTLFHNGLALRPEIDAHKNVFTWIVSVLYSSDTSTNVFPSLHVYTSSMIAFAFSQTELAKENKLAYAGIVGMAVLIILSTMFLKQHSVMDVTAGFLMAFLIWHAFGTETSRVRSHSLARVHSHR